MKKMLAVLLTVAMLFTAAPSMAYAAGSGDAAGLGKVQWWNFRNNDENNGITDKELPDSYETTSLKWASQVAPDYTNSCMPPLIIGDYLYTAALRYAYKIDKNTGKVVAKSEKLAGGVGYALNPMTYAEGMFFLQIGNGQVQALDAKTLKSLWISERTGGQTLQPITYRDGYIYTGTWNSEVSDGTYFCLSVKDEDPTRGDEIKKCVWKFQPTDNGDAPKGFYWAGSYVTDKYILFGADDGSEFGDYTPTATIYSLNPHTGKVIDQIDQINGDLRTTIVYNDGYAYFATKGGTLYKVPISEDGHFGKYSSINMNGMMTASPVVYNGRIYVGVCGQGGQFDADGGHCFAVINDDEELTDGSLAYTVPIPGYPQAAALLSTKTGEKGLVRLYFTYNAYPGGLYYIEDKPGRTSSKAVHLFIPESNMQQYCISTICCDDEGNLYYKNDTGYLMCVAKNRAYLKDVKASASTGEVVWDQKFMTSTLNYNLKVKGDTKNIKFKLDIPKGMKVTANGKACKESYTMPLDKDSAGTLKLKVTKGKYKRTYTFKVTGEGADATLGDILVSSSNTYGRGVIDYNPEFNSAFKEYNTVYYTEGRKFVNIWPSATDPNAKITVYAADNVLEKGVNEDGTMDPAGRSQNHYRYAVYFTPGKSFATVRIVVQSENKKNTRSYLMTVLRTLSTDKVEMCLNKEKVTLYDREPNNYINLYAFVANTDQKPVWEVDDDKVVTIDESGMVTAVGKGKTTVRAVCAGVEAECVITVKKSVVTLNKYKANLKLSAKKSLQLSAKINGTKSDEIKWSVTQGKGIVKVNAKGKVTPLKKGTAIVTASAGSIKKTCTITVK